MAKRLRQSDRREGRRWRGFGMLLGAALLAVPLLACEGAGGFDTLTGPPLLEPQDPQDPLDGGPGHPCLPPDRPHCIN